MAAVWALAPAALAQCVFSISPQSASFNASGGVGTVNITRTSGTNCTRTARSNVEWVTISFGQEGTDGGSAGYTVIANNTTSQRTGTLTVAGQTFTILQAAGTCQYQLTPSSATVAASGGSGSFSVSSACGWNPSTNASWLRITSGAGSGNGTVSWTADPNTTASQRSGTIAVGTSNFTITQSAACVITLSPTAVTVEGVGGTGTINVTSASTCSWRAATTSSWIALSGTTTETGNGSFSYTVAANLQGGSRTGRISVNDAEVIVFQRASNCTMLFTPMRGSLSAAGGNGVVAVTANCPWTATTATPWLTITSNPSGTGSGSVTYAAQANYEASARGAIISFGFAQYAIDQAGQACEIYLDELGTTFAAEGGNGGFHFSTMRDCTWQVTASADWIKITSPPAGSGEGYVAFTVLPNPTIQVRTGTVNIGTKSYTIRQAAAGCNVSLGVTTVNLQAAGGRGSIPITANCRWQASRSAGWIEFVSATEGTANANLEYSVGPNPGADARTATVTVNGQNVTFTQAGQRCSLSLSSNTAGIPARGGSGSVNVTGSGNACAWRADSNQDWLRTDWSSVSGSGVVRFSADANASGSTREAVVALGDQSLIVRQPAIAIQITAAGIVNAASFQGGPVAPGEIITVFGTGFGPVSLAQAQLSADGRSVTNAVADTKVLFDGIAAPMVYVMDGQLSTVTPFAVAEKQTTSIQVEYMGVRSNAVMLTVAAASPAIFSTILNQDYGINGSAAPAARGSVVQIFATGAGTLRPVGVDGQLAAAPLGAPVLPARIVIGGVEAQMTYAGSAPGLITGLIQVNAVVPSGVASGDVPVVLWFGGFESDSKVTLSIR